MDDDQIARLISEPKTIISRGKWSSSLGHKRREFVVSTAEGHNNYSLYLRQSLLLPSAFSCGLIWSPKSAEKLTLVRYNGCEHEHRNPLEGNAFEKTFHIHKATERYILAGHKADHFAEVTDRFSNLPAALLCLMADCNIEHHDDTNPTPDFFG